MCIHQQDCPCENKYTLQEHADFNNHRKKLLESERPHRERQVVYRDSALSIYKQHPTPENGAKLRMYQDFLNSH